MNQNPKNPQSVGKNSEEKNKAAISLEQVKSAVEQGNSILQAVHRNLEIKVDETTKEFVVKVVDRDTGKLVRQIPSEDMLKLMKMAREQEIEKSGSIIKDRA